VTVEGNALGVLDRESEMKLKERDLLSSKGFSLVARLENSPPTTARVLVKPETVLYPWQQQEQERQLEARRARYREKYETYAAQVVNRSTSVSFTPQEVDVEVAVRAYGDGFNSQEVATILSQSDRVLEWRASVPDSRSWEEYVRQAQDYIRQVQADADKQKSLNSELSR
jgi:hypothetical protein